MHYIYLFEIIFIHLFDIFSLLILLFQIQYCQLQHKLIDVRLFQYLSYQYLSSDYYFSCYQSISFLFFFSQLILSTLLHRFLFTYLLSSLLSFSILFSSHSHLISNIPLTVMLNFCRKPLFCVNRRQNSYLIP